MFLLYPPQRFKHIEAKNRQKTRKKKNTKQNKKKAQTYRKQLFHGNLDCNRLYNCDSAWPFLCPWVFFDAFVRVMTLRPLFGGWRFYAFGFDVQSTSEELD